MLILHVRETIIQNRLSIGLEPSGKIFQNNLLQLFNLTWIGYNLHSLDSRVFGPLRSPYDKWEPEWIKNGIWNMRFKFFI